MYVNTGRVIGLVDTVFDDLDDDFAGVETNSDLQARVTKPCDRVLHGQRCQASANGMVLMGAWCAEKRHDTVALYFVDDTVVAMDGILHEI